MLSFQLAMSEKRMIYSLCEKQANLLLQTPISSGLHERDRMAGNKI